MLRLLPLLLLAACAHTPETPYGVAKRSVDAQLSYIYYAKHDYRVIAEGVKAEGNCAVFAATYCDRLEDKGIDGEVYVYSLPDGEFHAVCVSGDIVLDNRDYGPRKINSSQRVGMLPAVAVKEWGKK